MKTSKKFKKGNKEGFSLVELMVSLTIFSIVMTISTGTLLVLIDMNAKAQALYSASTNLSFALDSMTREIRTGYRYNCFTVAATPTNTQPPDGEDVSNCSSGGNAIKFLREEDGARVAYRFNQAEGAIEMCEGAGCAGTPDWVAITAEDVVVDSLTVVVANSGLLPGDEAQPSVDISVTGYVNNGLDTNTDFNIQTHILQRRLDII